MNYTEACDAYATDQGLDPITDVLKGAGIPFEVDQTGGFVMLVNVPLAEGREPHLWLESGWDESEGGVTGMRYCGIDDCYGVELDSPGSYCSLDELPALVRREVARTVDCDHGWEV